MELGSGNVPAAAFALQNVHRARTQQQAKRQQNILPHIGAAQRYLRNQIKLANVASTCSKDYVFDNYLVPTLLTIAQKHSTTL